LNVAGSSGAAGGQASISSQLGANLGFGSQMSGLNQQYTGLTAQASAFSGQADLFGQVAGLGFGLAGRSKQIGNISQEIFG